MKKTALFWILIILLVAGGLWFFAPQKNTLPKQTTQNLNQQPTPTPSVTPSATQSSSNITIPGQDTNDYLDQALQNLSQIDTAK